MAKEPLLLNIETSTDVCSVAVSKGMNLLGIRTSEEKFQHAENLTSFISAALEMAGFSLPEIDAVVVSSGPGSYTSLRVGTSTAKGICFALGIPLISVDTLRALALAAKNELDLPAYYCPMIDARRMEVYCAIYDELNFPVAEKMAKIIEERTFDNFFATGKSIVFTGNGAEKCKDILGEKNSVFHPLECSASHMVNLAVRKFEQNDFENMAYYVPTYLKSPNITKPRKTGLFPKG